MKKTITALLLGLTLTANAQTYNQIDENGNVTQRNENSNFNPHSNDTTKSNKVVPKGIYVWTVDRRFGDINKADVDTLPHLYPHTTLGTGKYGQYNTTGSNFTPRQSRIFIERPEASSFIFTQPFDQLLKQPDEWHFTNTLSPITNLSYDNCGDKQNGEDHIQARFAVNAGKRVGLGFDLNYAYARGYFQNQSTSHFLANFYTSYLGDQYQMHVLLSTNHQKLTESGGIINDSYITHPELFTESFAENEIPTILESNWNRYHHQHLFLTHRYSLGYYKKVPMTEEELAARKFAAEAQKEKTQKPGGLKKKDNGEMTEAPKGRPDNAKVVKAEPKPVATDSTQLALADSLGRDLAFTDSLRAGRIKVDSKEKSDSLLAEQARQDSIDATMKDVFVPVTSFIHTAEVNNYQRTNLAYLSPNGYYANTYYDKGADKTYAGDSIYDLTRHLQVKNTVALALLEGFNKYAKAGLKGFISHEFRQYRMPTLDDNDLAVVEKTTENTLSFGAQLRKQEGHLWHYNLTGESWVAGKDAGQLKLDFDTDLNFKLLGDTVHLMAKAYFHRLQPTFYQRNYHSKHLWWDNDLEKETRTHIEGTLAFDKTHTRLRVAVENIKQYTYFGMAYDYTDDARTHLTAGVYQYSPNLSVLTAQLMQDLTLGPLHWDNVITYQTCNEEEVLPLPTLNVFSNLYLKFRIAHVLTVELGGALTYFTKYEAPDYLPLLGQFAVQQNADNRTDLGNFPFVDAYANLHLKHARFFVMMSNALASSANRMRFLSPHYPQNSSVLRLGVSWNFFN